MRGAVRTLLECVGEDPDREGLLDTPSRYAKALLFLTKGYQVNVEDIVNNALFREGHSEMVIVKDIEVFVSSSTPQLRNLANDTVSVRASSRTIHRQGLRSSSEIACEQQLTFFFLPRRCISATSPTRPSSAFPSSPESQRCSPAVYRSKNASPKKSPTPSWRSSSPRASL
jgi:hypothetical protein